MKGEEEIDIRPKSILHIDLFAHFAIIRYFQVNTNDFKASPAGIRGGVVQPLFRIVFHHNLT
jgi:hypothetical protein